MVSFFFLSFFLSFFSLRVYSHDCVLLIWSAFIDSVNLLTRRMKKRKRKKGGREGRREGEREGGREERERVVG